MSELFSELVALDPAVRRVWRIKLALTGSVLLLASVVYDVSNVFDDDRTLPLGLASGLVVAGFGALAAWVPGVRYRAWGYRLTGQELLLQHGVVNRVRTVVPLRRVQHLDVTQDVVEREFGLAKLIVHTAGTRSSEVVLPGLPIATADGLRDRIKGYITDDVV